jgi:hypothetical protein
MVAIPGKSPSWGDVDFDFEVLSVPAEDVWPNLPVDFLGVIQGSAAARAHVLSRLPIGRHRRGRRVATTCRVPPIPTQEMVG